MFVTDALDDDPNYHDYDWCNDESAEAAAICITNELLGFAEPTRRYQPPVSFDLKALQALTHEELSDLQDAENDRTIELITYMPIAREALCCEVW